MCMYIYKYIYIYIYINIYVYTYILKITRKVDSTGTAQLDYKSVFPMIKRSKSIKNLFARKTATFEISLNRGMFFSPVVLGEYFFLIDSILYLCRSGWFCISMEIDFVTQML
jgi:hypothetical protein